MNSKIQADFILPLFPGTTPSEAPAIRCTEFLHSAELPHPIVLTWQVR